MNNERKEFLEKAFQILDEVTDDCGFLLYKIEFEKPNELVNSLTSCYIYFNINRPGAEDLLQLLLIEMIEKIEDDEAKIAYNEILKAARKIAVISYPSIN